MELTPEILELLSSGKDGIREIRLTYQNGGQVVGTIRKLRLKPFKLVIDKSHPQPGESPKHRAVLDHMTEMKLTLSDGVEYRYPV